MPARRRKPQPPLKIATRSFIVGVLALILAIVIPLTSVNCTDDSGAQICFVTTYDGMDAHTFAVVLGVASALFFAIGAYYLWRHKQGLMAQTNGAVYPASQSFAPQQPGAYPPVQQPGLYAPIQQPGAYPPVQQPGAYPPVQQPGTYPPFQQSGGYPPVQNGVFPGGYAGDAPYQPPSNTFPRQ